MSVLKDILENGGFGITAEMAPPKGCDFTEQMEAAELLKGKVHGERYRHAVCQPEGFRPGSVH